MHYALAGVFSREFRKMTSVNMRIALRFATGLRVVVTEAARISG
jgi:hypothetical protein